MYAPRWMAASSQFWKNGKTKEMYRGDQCPFEYRELKRGKERTGCNIED
jgi:hypothetical protein